MRPRAGHELACYAERSIGNFYLLTRSQVYSRRRRLAWVSSSTRLSFTRGAQIGTVPEPTVTRRSRACPLPDHQPLAIRADLIDQQADVLLDLGLERRRDHPTSALPSETIERDTSLVVLPDREPANI